MCRIAGAGTYCSTRWKKGRVQLGLFPSLSSLGQHQQDTLQYYTTLTPTGNLDSQIHLTCMSSEIGVKNRTPCGYPRSHPDKMQASTQTCPADSNEGLPCCQMTALITDSPCNIPPSLCHKWGAQLGWQRKCLPSEKKAVTGPKSVWVI